MCEKSPNTEFFSGPCFPVFGLNTKIYFVNLRLWTLFTQWIRANKITFLHGMFWRFFDNFYNSFFYKQIGTFLIWSYKNTYHRSNQPKVFWEITILLGLIKFQGKTSIAESNFSKIVRKKTNALKNMYFFLNFSWEF